RNKITEFLNRRKHSQPLQIPNLGCFFKNPPQCSAGKLIDEAGLKGYRVGDMQVSTKHANFLVNMGKATFLDAFKLIQIVKDRVYKQFSIELKPEVKVVQ
ncbi:MAG: UDP-N-acetylenolpyruvoylglucosamine reductase, partial [Candidatus Cloacimonadota bacterium]|nr:UDP-N-acetylenolpyruvoylglucosamine reductase [Candidatus Cloacimonadota bacterium]